MLHKNYFTKLLQENEIANFVYLTVKCVQTLANQKLIYEYILSLICL